MSDILATSITLEDILAVAHQKRVPIAPELAGYLTLELADAVNASGATAIDTKTVYVSEEGSVALVKPKGQGDGADIETQLRRVLGDLLSVTGAQTSALSHVAKKKSGGGVRALAAELEAALIPVNRAAGRRALARMAREARRIALGLGRAGTLPAPEARKREPVRDPSREGTRESAPEPDPRSVFNEAPTVQRPRTPFPSEEALTAKRPKDPKESASVPKIPVPPVNRGPMPPPPPVRPPPQKRGPASPEKPAILGPKEMLFAGDEVDDLLSTFGVSGDASDDDKAMSHELKALVGLGPTPPPPGTEANFDDEPAPDPSEQLKTNRIERALPRGRRDDVRAEQETREAPPVSTEGAATEGASTEGASSIKDGVDDLLDDLAANPNAEGSGAGDGIEDLLSMSDESAALGAPRGPMSTAHPIESDEPPRPIAVATVKKADIQSAPQIRTPEPERREARQAARPPQPAAPAKARPAPSAEAASAANKVPASTAVPSGREPKAPKSTMLFLVIFLLVLGGGAVAVWKLAPGFFTGRTPENVQREKEQYEAKKAALEKAAEAQRCKAAISITDAPAGAEILLRKGQAPVDVERMPVKTRLEFVATAEGFAPRRAVVLPTAPWDNQKKPPRFDLAVQLDASKAKAPALDPWPSGEPGTDVGGEGEPGTVHVVSAPPGAEVWLLAGLGPEARIDRLKCDDGAEVLIAGSQIRKRLRVAPGDAAKAPVDGAGFHVVTLSAKGD